ncbi:PAS domain-containing sensor histidine kinase [Aminobacter sp. HY435]|uniref:PAS domain-containing sensor histidine kinase n=1 Tax=Aminobacter sp. HY435 TaxID=2970917 RepID=UPI0022B96D1C|nr:PAS domain-containing sensor histidine kinase [Aminobacter sp. HY435]
MTRYGEFSGAMAGGCDRLVHPSVSDAERPRQRRLVGLLLAAPFLLAGAGVVLVSANLGAASTFAVIFAAFSLSWLAALLIAASGKAPLVASSALVAGAGAIAAIVAAAGGLTSPAALLLAALPFEAYWVWRTRSAILAGAAAAIVALLLQPILGSLPFAAGAAASAWQWLLPLAWAAAVAARALKFAGQSESENINVPAGALEDLLEAVVLRIARNGDVVDVSEQSRSMLRLQPEFLLGTAFFDRIHVADRVGYLCALADMRDGASLRHAELRLRLPRQSEGEAGDNFHPFALEFMRAEGQSFVALVRDNATVADLRQELAKAADAVKGAELAKSNFLAAVSHELRTPLNAIIGFSDMLLHEMFGPFAEPRQKEYVGIVRESGQHLLDVVNSILDVSKIESGCYAINPEPFRFREAVDMCASMMALQAEAKAHKVSVEIAAGVGEVKADRRAVQQILINLLSNAVKFTPDGGRVDVGAKRLGSRLHFWVSDTGIGVAEEDLSRLGTPFMQVQNDYTRRFEGTGLGLSLVKGLVALHDGTMSIESAPGEGTTVTISLPVEGPALRPEPTRGELMRLPAGKAKEVRDGSLRKAG